MDKRQSAFAFRITGAFVKEPVVNVSKRGVFDKRACYSCLFRCLPGADGHKNAAAIHQT